MKLTKAEADLLLPIGVTEFAGSVSELAEEVNNTYWVIDDAPYPHWEKEKMMETMRGLGVKHGFEVGVI